MCASEVLLAELQGVLSRGKFAAPLAQAGLTPEGIASDLRRLAVAVSPASVPRVVPTDPDDDHVLAAALTGAADVIDSGDKRDLLPLGSDQGIPIVMTREALVRLEAQRSGSGLETGGLTLALTLAPLVRGVVAIE